MKIHSFIILSIVKLSFSNTPYKKYHDSKSIEGDDLIDKILSANKFMELADKIIDKALAKFNNKTSSSATSLQNMKKVNLTPKFKTNTNKVSMKTKKKDHKHKPAAKINVDAVLQREALPFKDLSFRYESFTKTTPSTTSDRSIPTINDDDKALSANMNDENVYDNSVKQEDKSKTRDYSDEKSKSDKDDDSESKEQPNSNTNKKTDFSSENFKFNVNPQSTELETVRPKSGENQFGDEKTINWNKNGKEDIKTSDGKKTTGHTPEMYNRADDTVHSVSDDEKQPDDLPPAEQEEIKERKRITRKEGEKVYALNESPDYAEYHEKLAEMKKSTLRILNQ